MKQALIWLGVAVGVALVILFLFTTIKIQGISDFFAAFDSDRFDVPLDGKMHSIDFSILSDGVELGDKLFLKKKAMAWGYFVSLEQDFREKPDIYFSALIEASEDNTLTLEEFVDLKKMDEDILTEDQVNNWIKMAQELEKRNRAKRKKLEKQ